MEFVVKLTGDQQGLQQTVKRMVEDFKRTNVSMPVSWTGQQAAMSRYGSIISSASSGTKGFDKFQQGLSQLSPALGNAASGLAHLAAPIAAVAATLGLMKTVVGEVVGAMKQSAADLRTGRITGMSGLMARRWREAAGAAGIDEGSAAGMVNRLNAQVGAFNAGDETAQKLFGELGINPSEMSVDDLLMAMKKKMGGIPDPAKRARLSKGLMGRGAFESTELFSKLEFTGDADAGYGAAIADAASGVKATKKAKRVLHEMSDEFYTRAAAAVTDLGRVIKVGFGAYKDFMFMGYPTNFDFSRPKALKSGVAGSEEDKPEKESKAAKAEPKVELFTTYLWSDGTIRGTREGKAKAGSNGSDINSRFGFQPDALAQAGLFAGSSLLMNPNLTVERDQLEALRKIEANTARNRSIFS